MTPLRVLETCLYVNDLVAARAFYVGVLGLEVHSTQPGRDLFLRCGNAMLLLFVAEATQVSDGTLPAHGCTGIGHAAFAVPGEELAAWETRLDEAGIPIEQRVTWPNGARSVYFRDPAGNILEFAMPELWA